jgi:hypothetical protein
MPGPDPNPFADCDVVVCYGGAKLASIIHCIDDEIPAGCGVVSDDPKTKSARRRLLN